MTHDEACRIARDPSADPILRYEARVLLGEIERPLPNAAPGKRRDNAKRDWSRWVDSRIDEKLAEQQKFLLAVFGEALGQALAKERKAAKCELDDSVRSLQLELAQAQTVISELRCLIAAERTAPLDMPSPRRARAN